jgi:hypothetical protein
VPALGAAVVGWHCLAGGESKSQWRHAPRLSPVIKHLEKSMADADPSSQSAATPGAIVRDLAQQFWKCRPSKGYAGLVIVAASLYCLLMVTLNNWRPGVGALVQGAPTTIVFLCVSAGALGSQSLGHSDKFRSVLRACFFFSGALTLFAGTWLTMADVGCHFLGPLPGRVVSLLVAFLLWLALVLAFARHIAFG